MGARLLPSTELPFWVNNRVRDKLRLADILVALICKPFIGPPERSLFIAKASWGIGASDEKK